MAEHNPTPAHIDDTVQAITRLHEEHRDRATGAQRLVARTTAFIAQPRFMALGCVAVFAWVVINAAAPALGWRSLDPAPFSILEAALTLFALAATILVLSTQRRDDEIAAQREQLSLQLAMLNDHKIAKVIALLEELRRDHPDLRDRVDTQADEMAVPADTQQVLNALRDD